MSGIPVTEPTRKLCPIQSGALPLPLEAGATEAGQRYPAGGTLTMEGFIIGLRQAAWGSRVESFVGPLPGSYGLVEGSRFRILTVRSMGSIVLGS